MYDRNINMNDVDEIEAWELDGGQDLEALRQADKVHKERIIKAILKRVNKQKN